MAIAIETRHDGERVDGGGGGEIGFHAHGDEVLTASARPKRDSNPFLEALEASGRENTKVIARGKGRGIEQIVARRGIMARRVEDRASGKHVLGGDGAVGPGAHDVDRIASLGDGEPPSRRGDDRTVDDRPHEHLRSVVAGGDRRRAVGRRHDDQPVLHTWSRVL